MASPLARTLARLKSREAEWHANPSDVWGLDTGLLGLNRLLGGLQPGFTILGARTSHGKSALAMQIAMHAVQALYAAWAGKPEGTAPGAEGLVLVFTPEMTELEIMGRFASQRSGVPSRRIKTGQASAAERDEWLYWCDVFANLHPWMHLHAGSSVTFDDIYSVIEELHGGDVAIKLVVIDYIQRLRLGRVGGDGNRYEALSEMATRLKDLSNRLEVPFLVAAQLNRGIEKDRQGGQERPPELSDIEGSGGIEQACDVGMLLWRPPDPQISDEAKPQEATVFVRKNRDGGVGSVKLWYYPKVVLFADADARPRSEGGLR